MRTHDRRVLVAPHPPRILRRTSRGGRAETLRPTAEEFHCGARQITGERVAESPSAARSRSPPLPSCLCQWQGQVSFDETRAAVKERSAQGAALETAPAEVRSAKDTSGLDGSAGAWPARKTGSN